MKFMTIVKKYVVPALVKTGKVVGVAVLIVKGAAVSFAQSSTNVIAELQAESLTTLGGLSTFQKTILLAGVPLVVGFVAWKLFKKATNKAT